MSEQNFSFSAITKAIDMFYLLLLVALLPEQRQSVNNPMKFEYQGALLHFESFGEGRPLLILHGWGSSAQVMKPLSQAFSDKHRVFLVDLPGFGKSPEPPQAWDVANYTDLIQAFSEEIITEKTDVIAHSFGGRIMLKWCARPNSADRVGKVLLTGGAGMKPRRSPSFYLRKYSAKTLKAPFMILPEPFRGRGLSALRQTRVWKKLGSSDYQNLSEIMRGTFVKVVSEFLEPTLPHIQQEVLLLWGSDDKATPVYQAERLEKGIKQAALVTIEQAGHYAFLDQPEKFLAIARAFLSKPIGDR